MYLKGSTPQEWYEVARFWIDDGRKGRLTPDLGLLKAEATRLGLDTPRLDVCLEQQQAVAIGEGLSPYKFSKKLAAAEDMTRTPIKTLFKKFDNPAAN